MDDLDINELDLGIRDTVAFLRDNGFDATDSGDGTKADDMKCALPVPNIAIVTTPAKLIAEADRLAQLVLATGHALAPCGDDDATTAEIQASYDPVDHTAMIMVINFVVPWAQTGFRARHEA